MKTFIKKLFKPVDLTKGTPWKVIVIFALPILVSTLFQQLYNVTDLIIIGQNLDASSIAGVNDTSSLSYIFLQFALGCASGFSVVTANRFGNKDMEGVRKSFACQIILSFFISIIITVLAIVLIPYLLAWVNVYPSVNGATNPVYTAAYTYLFIYFLGITGQIYYNLLVSVLRSIGDSVNPLIFLIISTILNICLDLLFIVVFHWGVAGAAIATIIAQFLSAIMAFIYTYLRYKELRLKLSDFKMSWKEIYNHLKLGLPLAFQFSILAIGLIVLQGTVISFDEGVRTYAQHAYGAVSKFMSLITCPLVVMGTAMLSYCGQNYGAKQFKRVKQGINQALLISFILYLIILSIAMLCCINGGFLYLFLDKQYVQSETIKYATTYMYCTAPLYFLLGTLYIYRYSLQGINRPVFPFLSGILELIARVCLATFLPSIINPSNPIAFECFVGIAFSDPLAWLFAATIMGVGIIKYVYLNKELNEDKEINNIEKNNKQ